MLTPEQGRDIALGVELFASLVQQWKEHGLMSELRRLPRASVPRWHAELEARKRRHGG